MSSLRLELYEVWSAFITSSWHFYLAELTEYEGYLGSGSPKDLDESIGHSKWREYTMLTNDVCIFVMVDLRSILNILWFLHN